MSWRNPDARHAAWDLDTYVQAVLDALDAVERITGAEPDRADRHLLRRHPRQHRPPPTWPATGRDDRLAAFGLLVTVLDNARAGIGAALTDRRLAAAAKAMSQAPRLPRRPGPRRGLRLAAARRPGLELLGEQLPAGQEAAGVRHPVLERRHHPDDRRAARRLRRPGDGQPAVRRRRRSPCSACRSTCPAIDTRRLRRRRHRRPHHAVAELLPQHAAARRRRPGSCCPPAATSPRWSTRRATRRPSYQVNKDNPADPPSWLATAPDAAGQLVARRRRPGSASAAARPEARPGSSSAAAACGRSSTPPAPTSSTAEGQRTCTRRSAGRRGTDYFRIADQLTPEERDYLQRTRDFVDDEVLPVINDYWERAEFPSAADREAGQARHRRRRHRAATAARR